VDRTPSDGRPPTFRPATYKQRNQIERLMNRREQPWMAILFGGIAIWVVKVTHVLQSSQGAGRRGESTSSRF
jgi:hypothetical protein